MQDMIFLYVEVKCQTRLEYLMQRFVPTGVSLDITEGMGRNKVDIIKLLLKNVRFFSIRTDSAFLKNVQEKTQQHTHSWRMLESFL